MGVGNTPPADSSVSVETEHGRFSPWLTYGSLVGKAPLEETGELRRYRRRGANISENRRVYCARCSVTLPRMATQFAVQVLRRRQREEAVAGRSLEKDGLMGDASTTC